MQFNKIPQLAMHWNERDGGIFSQGIGRENIQTLEPIVLSQVSMRETISSHLPFFVLYTQSFNFSRRVVEAVNALGRERHGSKFRD